MLKCKRYEISEKQKTKIKNRNGRKKQQINKKIYNRIDTTEKMGK